MPLMTQTIVDKNKVCARRRQILGKIKPSIPADQKSYHVQLSGDGAPQPLIDNVLNAAMLGACVRGD